MSQDEAALRRLRRRFLVLVGLRWLPVGLLLPVIVLLVLDRGLTLTQLGIVFAAQGVIVLLLELPTGGLADVIGRRRVLLLAGVFDMASIAVLILARSLPLLALAFALQGVYRALESGPLDAWYVDRAQLFDPEADIERGLAGAGVAVGIALGAGSLASSAIVAIDPPAVEALVAPVVVALALRLVDLAFIGLLMTESIPRRVPPGTSSVVGGVGRTIRATLRMIRSSRLLLALLTIEAFWGFGMIAFEAYTPARLAEVLDDAEQAAIFLGPAGAVAWIAAALGAVAVPVLTAYLSPWRAGAVLRVAQGLTVLGIALLAGPIGVIVAFVVTMGIHGASNPIHQGLLHRGVSEPSMRATAVSADSMTAQAGAMLGGLALGALADATSLPVAIAVGAGALAIVAPLYAVAGRSMASDLPPA